MRYPSTLKREWSSWGMTWTSKSSIKKSSHLARAHLRKRELSKPRPQEDHHKPLWRYLMVSLARQHLNNSGSTSLASMAQPPSISTLEGACIRGWTMTRCSAAKASSSLTMLNEAYRHIYKSSFNTYIQFKLSIYYYKYFYIFKFYIYLNYRVYINDGKDNSTVIAHHHLTSSAQVL